MGGRGSQEEEDEDVERKEKIISGTKAGSLSFTVSSIYLCVCKCIMLL